MEKIALIIPNFYWQKADAHTRWHVVPYNLCLLAATVRDLCEIKIIDANADNLSQEELSALLQKECFALVGITVMMDQFAQAGHCAARIARKALPKAKIIMGGVYPTVNPDKVIDDASVDYAFMGEGEEGFRQLLLHFLCGEAFPAKGLAWKDAQGLVHMQEKTDFIKNLNANPRPAYDLVDYKKYTLSAPRKSVDSPCCFPFARIQTSRGCPQGCCFCQVNIISGSRFRPRSPENILDEIAWLKEEYGIRSLLFDDDNIVTQRSRAVALFQGMIDRGLAMPWKAIAMAVFKLDEELLTLMAASGCTYIDVAIESGSPRVLKEVIKKPVNLEYAKRMVAFAQSQGIYVAANFILGFPTETWNEIRQTLRFAEELNMDYAKIFTAIPLRHTRLWDMCEQHNAFRPNFSIDTISWNEGQIVSPHFFPSELALLRAYEWDRINFSSLERRAKTAAIMNITLDELDIVRKKTREAALQSLRNDCKD